MSGYKSVRQVLCCKDEALARKLPSVSLAFKSDKLWFFVLNRKQLTALFLSSRAYFPSLSSRFCAVAAEFYDQTERKNPKHHHPADDADDCRFLLFFYPRRFSRFYASTPHVCASVRVHARALPSVVVVVVVAFLFAVRTSSVRIIKKLKHKNDRFCYSSFEKVEKVRCAAERLL